MMVPSTTSYDEVPYADRVHPATHPDLLAVVATLHGMDPRRRIDAAFSSWAAPPAAT